MTASVTRYRPVRTTGKRPGIMVRHRCPVCGKLTPPMLLDGARKGCVDYYKGCPHEFFAAPVIPLKLATD